MGKGRFGKGILVGLLIFMIIFIALNMYIFLKTGVEQTALITAVFSFGITEVLKLGSIKVNKIKYDYNKEGNSDDGCESNNEYSDSVDNNY